MIEEYEAREAAKEAKGAAKAVAKAKAKEEEKAAKRRAKAQHALGGERVTGRARVSAASSLQRPIEDKGQKQAQ